MNKINKKQIWNGNFLYYSVSHDLFNSRFICINIKIYGAVVAVIEDGSKWYGSDVFVVVKHFIWNVTEKIDIIFIIIYWDQLVFLVFVACGLYQQFSGQFIVVVAGTSRFSQLATVVEILLLFNNFFTGLRCKDVYKD